MSVQRRRDYATMSSVHSAPHRQQPHQLLRECRDLIQLLQSIDGSNASVREAAQGGQHKNCVDLLTGVQDATKNLNDVTDTDLHVPDSGLAVYAFATPFILIIGNCSAAPL